MKKMFHNKIAVLATLTVFTSISLFTSCSKKAELIPVNLKPIVYQNENVTVKVDSKLELLMIAMRLAEIKPFSNDSYGQEYSQFVVGVDKLFSNQKDHPLVKTLKSHFKNYKGAIIEILKITRYISDDMTQLTINKKELPKEMLSFWKDINLNDFIVQFNDFAVKGNFERICLLYEAQLKRQAISVNEYYNYNRNITEWFSKFYFSPEKQTVFELKPSTLFNDAIYVPAIVSSDNKNIIEAVCPSFWTKEEKWPAIRSCIELSYGYNFILVQKYWDVISEDANRIIKSLYEKHQITDKITEFTTQYNVASVLTLTELLDYDFVKEDEEVYASFKNSITNYYLIDDVDKIISIIDCYKENRDQYPDYESFFSNYITTVLKDF